MPIPKVLIAIGCLATCNAWAGTSADSLDGIRTTRLSEPQLRSLVTHAALPDVADFNLPQNAGPAVAEVTLSSRGKLMAIAILEAPTLEVAKALQLSLQRWKFKQTPAAKYGLEIGKLTFYFKKVGSQLSVVAPAEASGGTTH